MKLKKTLILVLCSMILMTQMVFAAGEKTKDGYVIMTLEELNKKIPKKIYIQDFYGGCFYNSSVNIKMDYSKIENMIPDIYKRINHYPWEKEIDTCKIKCKTEITNNYSYIFHVTDIENLRTLEEVETKKQAMQQRVDRLKEITTDKIKEIEAPFDLKGADIAKDYTYHGVEEKERNIKLLLNKAFEKNHAYYIPNFSISGSFAEIYVDSFEKKLISVIYSTQALKAEIVDSGKTDVVIAGGTYLPTVIGTLSGTIDNQISDYNYVYYFDLENESFKLKKFEQYEKELGIQQE